MTFFNRDGLVDCQPMMLNPRTPEIYIGKFPLTQLQIPQTVLLSGSATTLSKTYWNCFNLYLDQLGFLQPSLTYVLATDPCYQHIIAAVSFSRRLDEIPNLYYRTGNLVYLFNVCTHPTYRGHGYMKELLTRSLRDLMTYPRSPELPQRFIHSSSSREWINPTKPTFIYLSVNQTNTAAIKLYTGLGFTTIGSTNKPSGIFNIMILQIPKVVTTPMPT